MNKPTESLTVPFNRPPVTGRELSYIEQAIASSKLSGDGHFAKKCENWLENKTKTKKVLLTPSCTHALEMAALLVNIQPGDEVIMPSYTFVSTANAFVLRGAKIVFVDIRPDTMNIDESKIEAAITQNTKAIVPVHYAGVGCEMDTIMHLADKYDLFVIEDAAQGMMSEYKGRPLGSIGHLAAFSFHETKNYTSGGEGGALLINDSKFIERAEILREKGTDRSKFFKGMVDKYSWVDMGSSMLPSEIQAAYLFAQLESAEQINQARLKRWNQYFSELAECLSRNSIKSPLIPKHCKHNAHMFYLKFKNGHERSQFISYMKDRNILAVFHYLPLHTTKAGQTYSRFHGSDENTTIESEKLVRLPLYFNMSDDEFSQVLLSTKLYLNNKAENTL
ncbi:dTDP-4-amino-4,6-dideoxygalactose transaminase [Vibrio tubiashii]|uniref:dTDP-4-amino-4,6-dideoxygalactose transaminase n=1 Tax=Vibrio tubiashii TaxID=29498 RepID=UPI00234E6961|nr:dTDP-4-amino-4,6-dideoxygalactose transaminase [Vibrio tubiashii]WCP67259.1 dTDP-4-amino-4,6-dideoxygalactose transaminase [Vibrio tubiashii]